MEKRNTLLLTVIAVATLLVAVVGATFAYFASSQDDYANGNIFRKIRNFDLKKNFGVNRM